MTAQELVARFPEIPRDLHGEPLLAEYAAAFTDQLGIARNPGACSAGYDAANHYYLKLMGPIRLYWYKLSTREKVLKQLQELLDQYRADPVGFVASLAPRDAAETEVRGPGCS
ncbi:MAG: hypothetical protein ACREKR_06105 [Candidatus Methylomirabilales bacterium]